MPSDLLELTRQIQGQSARGAELGEHFLKTYRAGMENEQLRRNMEAEQQLRALFARGQQPSMGEIGQYAPELAMKYNPMGLENLKLQSEIMKSQQQMAESQQKQEFERLNRQGQAVVPLIDQYHAALQQGMPEPQAQERFRAQLGQLIPALEQSGIGFKAGLTNNVTPEQLEQIYAGVNAPSMRLQSMMEQQKARAGELGRSSVMPRMTAEQTYGGYQMTPEGYAMRIPPVAQGGASGMSGMSEQQLIKMANNERMPAEQQAAIAEIERRQGGNVPEYGPGATITPEQLRRERTAGKAEEAAAVEAAKSAQAQRGQLEKMDIAFDKQHLKDLIQQATPGGVSKYVTQAAEFAMQDTPWAQADAQLEIASGALLQAVPRFEGPQSDSDRKAYEKFAGDLANPEKLRSTRIKALDEMERLLNKYKISYGGGEKPAPEQPASNRLRIGDIKNGHEYLGGDPNKKESWRAK